MSRLINMFFFKEITKSINDGSPVNIPNLDFQKALDSATSKITITLETHGIGDGTIEWIYHKDQY